jgi:muramoyltetrapeptide carboxypeptidase
VIAAAGPRRHNVISGRVGRAGEGELALGLTATPTALDSAGPRTRPRRLERGATIAVVSPASPVLDAGALHSGTMWLEEQGFRVRTAPHVNEDWGYAAGRPEVRVHDLEGAFADPAVDAILCAGGGHASSHLLRRLDYDLIAANPKPFVGFSDITVLHAAIGRSAGLVTFWGPMLGQLGGSHPFSRESLLRALTSTAPLGDVDPDGPPGRTLASGVAEGELVGGTTSLLSSLLGTPWEPDTRGKILLLEDVGEEPCRVDRHLTHLLNAGKLEACAGICFAEHVNCVPDPVRPRYAGPSLSLEDILAHTIAELGIPAIHGLPLGHGRRLATVPLGAQARLDADAGRLEMLEPGLDT